MDATLISMLLPARLEEAQMDEKDPQIPCCQCNVIMEAYLQLGTQDDEDAYFVTCMNIRCVMDGYTFSVYHYPPKNLIVYLPPPVREGVLKIYIDLVRNESKQAADAVERIYRMLGAEAALRAALAITVFRMEVKQYSRKPDLAVYAYLIQDYPEALPLLESAMEWCLRNWGIRHLDNVHLKIGDPL